MDISYAAAFADLTAPEACGTFQNTSAPGYMIGHMHELTGDRKAVVRVLERTILLLEENRTDTADAGVQALSLASARAWQPRRDELVERLQSARDWDRREGQIAEAAAFVPSVRSRICSPGVAGETWYLPRHRTLALFQSAMDEYIERMSEQEVVALTWTSPEQFDVTDPLWATVVLQKAQALLRGKARFPKHASKSDFRFQLENEARIALVADWGTGNDSARAVARQIEKKKPHHIIHLGDVYYSGDEREVRKRFLDGWPKPDSLHRSWALNSNHEMYSGGHGYFKAVLPEFSQGASYFNLGNDHWRVIGLDTGYVNHNLNMEQADWLAGQIEGSARFVFLTHHPYYSAFEEQGEKLERWVDGILSTGKVEAWFWGHEHKLVIYERAKGVKGRCIGHGGIPYLIPPEQGEREEFPIEFIHTRGRPDHPDRGVNGFALLTLNGKELHVEYVDQDGKTAHKEDL
jgi:hypothetical protein